MKLPKTDDENRIRPEVRALAKRGNVTLAEWENFRGNSWELELVASNLTDEAYLVHAEHMIKNCQCDSRKPRRSYNEAVMLDVAPDLIRRLRRALMATIEDARQMLQVANYEDPARFEGAHLGRARRLVELGLLEENPCGPGWFCRTKAGDEMLKG